MFIRKVVLENIGPYSEKTVFDFSTTPSRNLILIGGKNGSGKTTLLKAIKIGVFGTFAFGMKTVSEKYIDNLKSILNYRDIEKDGATFHISVFIEIDEEYQSFQYEFSRNWEIKNHKLTETFDVLYEGQKLELVELVRVFEQVKEGFPPKVIDSAIYDGEKIADIIDDDLVSDYIEALFKTSFNLVYFEKLIQDTESYVENEALLNSANGQELVLFELYKKLKQIGTKIKDIDETISNYKRTIFDKQNIKRLNEYEFKKFDGIQKEDKEDLLKKINSLEAEKYNLNQRIKHEIESDYVFLCSRNLLDLAKKRIETEKPHKLLGYIDEIENHFVDFDFKLNEIREELRKGLTETKQILKIDRKTETRLLNILNNCGEARIESFRNDVQEYFDVIRSNKKFKEIMSSSNRSELDTILNTIAEVNSDISKLSDKVNELIVDKENAIAEQIIIKDRLSKAEVEYKVNRKSENSFDVARNVIKVLEDTMIVLKRKNLVIVSDMASITFKKILRKDNYITKIEIDENFEITILDIDSRVLPLHLLSAGEKQLIVSSLIYSIFKCSNRDMFFIFDTPLARLDNDNRELFVKIMIEDISSQAIVLSTDSEINKELFEKIAPRISKKYTLEYNENENKTHVVPQYFGFSEGK